jgi:glucose-6-phosphate isomerase
MIKLNLQADKLSAYVSADELALFRNEVALHHRNIYKKTGKGNDFLGWVDLPSKTSEESISRLIGDAARITGQSEVFVVVGIGGSYLGARAVNEALGHAFAPLLNSSRKEIPTVLYAGHHLEGAYLQQLLEVLDEKDYSLIVISKSGTTTEPAVAFRLLKQHLEKKYGKKNASKRVFVVTDARQGALKRLAEAENYSSYVIPDDVGGRYSVLSPVGLLPIASAGIDIRALIRGARNMEEQLQKLNTPEDNLAAKYAVIRNILYRKGKTIEILAAYNPSLFYLTEWWKQLYGESEGKEGKGIFPAGVSFTTDLHSMGQYIQDGLRNLFETHLIVEQSDAGLKIPHDADDRDGLNYLSGKSINHVNHMAAAGTMLAHAEGDVPVMELRIPGLSPETLGELIYFFEMACAYSGYILDVNPFDQPGVEAYKRKMFELLGKSGY